MCLCVCCSIDIYRWEIRGRRFGWSFTAGVGIDGGGTLDLGTGRDRTDRDVWMLMPRQSPYLLINGRIDRSLHNRWMDGPQPGHDPF